MTHLANFWNQVSTWVMGFGGLSGLIGFCLLLIWYFTPPILSSREARAILLNVGLAFVSFAFVSGYFVKIGYQTCTNVIAARDNAAIGRAADGVKEIESCRDNGGSWNVINGTCVKAR